MTVYVLRVKLGSLLKMGRVAILSMSVFPRYY